MLLFYRKHSHQIVAVLLATLLQKGVTLGHMLASSYINLDSLIPGEMQGISSARSLIIPVDEF